MRMKSPVTRPLNKDEYQLTFPYEEVCSDGELDYFIRVHPGFVFDGASIPRFAWSILGLYPMSAQLQGPALIHDALYGAEMFDRLTCDRIFYRDLRRQGIGWARASTMYRAVRIGGGFCWAAHTPGMVDLAKTYIEIQGLAA